MSEKLGIANDPIKLIAMDDKEAAPIGRGMLRLSCKLYACDFKPEPIAEKFIVISRDVNNLCAMTGHAQDQPNDLIMIRIPIPGTA
jgi:hypothetical protein